MFFWKLIAVLIVATISLSGCGSLRPKSPPEALNCGLKENGFVVDDIFADRNTYRLEQLRIGVSPSFNVLALSAGGEFGAYGSGFLVGWKSVGASAKPSPRNAIQVVTGVSTGAIMATHAFLGEDESLEKLYTESSGSVIYQERFVLDYTWANSLLDTTGKDKLIANNITSELIDDVAKEGQKGRALYVGIVNLDSGEFVRVNMTKLAATDRLSTSDRDDCYRAVIGASSAIPIAFSPKFIDGQMWVDGGTRRHLFIVEPSSGSLDSGDRRLFSFVHGDLDVAPTKVTNGVLQIASRVSDLMTDQVMKDSIRLQDSLASTCPGKSPCSPKDRLFEPFYVSAASAAKQCSIRLQECKTSGVLSDEDMFCQPFMQCLAKQGEIDGKDYAIGNRKWLTSDDLCLGSKIGCQAEKVPQIVSRRLFR